MGYSLAPLRGWLLATIFPHGLRRWATLLRPSGAVVGDARPTDYMVGEEHWQASCQWHTSRRGYLAWVGRACLMGLIGALALVESGCPVAGGGDGIDQLPDLDGGGVVEH